MNIFSLINHHRHCRQCGNPYVKFHEMPYSWQLCPKCGLSWVLKVCREASIKEAKTPTHK